MFNLKHYQRVIGLAQILYLAGRTLKKQGVKYTALAGIFTLLALITDMIGRKVLGFELPLTPFKAVLFPVIIAFCTFGVGNFLTGLSNLLSAEKLLLADANALNLMEDFKKSKLADHLAIL